MTFSTPEFWILVAFILLFCFLGKRIYGALVQLLDKHSQTVAQQLEEAKHLQDEAASLLKTYKAKYKNALKEIEDLHTFAEKEVADFKRSTDKAFLDFKKDRDKLAKERIELVQEEFLGKLRSEIVDTSLALVEKTILKDEKVRKALTLSTLQDLKKNHKVKN